MEEAGVLEFFPDLSLREEACGSAYVAGGRATAGVALAGQAAYNHELRTSQLEPHEVC